MVRDFSSRACQRTLALTIDDGKKGYHFIAGLSGEFDIWAKVAKKGHNFVSSAGIVVKLVVLVHETAIKIVLENYQLKINIRLLRRSYLFYQVRRSRKRQLSSSSSSSSSHSSPAFFEFAVGNHNTQHMAEMLTHYRRV